MWRDPLDELIADLEQIPAVDQSRCSPEARGQLLLYIDTILYGSDQARRRLERDPRFQAYQARMAATAQAAIDADGAEAATPVRPNRRRAGTRR